MMFEFLRKKETYVVYSQRYSGYVAGDLISFTLNPDFAAEFPTAVQAATFGLSIGGPINTFPLSTARENYRKWLEY